MTPILRLRGVRFGYTSDAKVVENLDLDVGPGLTLLAGRNGSGKSTLLKLLAGVERPDAGSVQILGLDLWRQEAEARAAIAYLPEEPDVTPYASILEVVRLVCALRREPLASGLEALEAAGLAPYRSRSIRELSKGQRRRALLAAAWIGAPPLLLLDEPLDGMDSEIRTRILDWIDQRCGHGGSAVVATPRFDRFAERAARCIAMRGGEATILADLPAGRAIDAIERHLAESRG